jgi:hypothetical protein
MRDPTRYYLVLFLLLLILPYQTSPQSHIQKVKIKSKQVFLILLSLIFIWQFDLSAQEVTGKIVGRVKDKNGLAISSVLISVSSPDLQGIRSTQTDKDGSFTLVLLPPGFYTAKITHIAYRPVTIDSIQVRLGKTTYAGELVLEEKPYEMGEIIVKDRRILIDPNSTVSGGTFTKTEIENLPLQRNYQDIPLLLPQVNTSFYGDGNSYAGSTGSDNRFFIDGIDVTDPVYNIAGTNLPYNFIREIEVKTGGYEAEYKSSLGGVVNVITQSGGDKFSGQTFGFYTNSRISNDAGVVTETPKGDYAYYDFGLSLGGPIIKENLWFNLSYNPNIVKEDILIPGIGYYPDKKISHLFAGKLSWRISDKAQVLLNVLGDPSINHNVESSLASGLNSYENPEAALIYSQEGGYSASISGYYIVSDNFLLEASFSRFLSRNIMEPETEIGKQTAFLDYTNGTISGGYGASWNETAVRINWDIKTTLTLNDHKIKAGIEYVDNNFKDALFSEWVQKFSDSSYFKTLHKIQGTVGNRVPSFFIQDFWKINNYFQLNAGFRWDGQYIINSNGGVSQKILDQFQPRIGLIFLTEQNDEQKLFATYGRFYHDLNMVGFRYFYIEDLSLTGLSYNHDPRFDPTGADTSFIYYGEFQENIKNLEGQYYDEFSLGYEKSVLDNNKISTRGIFRRLGNGIDDAYSAELGKFVLANPGSYPLSEYPKVKRDYYALEISFGKISNDPFNYYLSYVLSRTYGNYAGLFNPESGQYEPNVTEYFDFPENVVNSTGLLPYDRTHVFKFFGSYRFDFGLMLGASFTWMSGTPLNEYGSTIYGADYSSYLKPRGTAGRTPSIWDLNIRIAYLLPNIELIDYRARLLLDVFHLASQEKPVNFDQKRYLSVDENGNQIDPNPTYGRATAFQPAMALRIGLEVSF